MEQKIKLLVNRHAFEVLDTRIWVDAIYWDFEVTLTNNLSWLFCIQLKGYFYLPQTYTTRCCSNEGSATSDTRLSYALLLQIWFQRTHQWYRWPCPLLAGCGPPAPSLLFFQALFNHLFIWDIGYHLHCQLFRVFILLLVHTLLLNIDTA